MADRTEWVELGLCCADVCNVNVLDRVGGEIDQLISWVKSSIHRSDSSLTYAFYRRIVTEIRAGVIKWRQRSAITRFVHTKRDLEAIVTWQSDINRILRIVRSSANV